MLIISCGAVIIVGLSLGLYGYDNSFAAPLMQLPFFIENYQGLAISFTVSNFPSLFPMERFDIADTPIHTGSESRSPGDCAAGWSRPRDFCCSSSHGALWSQDHFDNCVLLALRTWLISSTLCP